jgi:hypothetical protein
MLNWHKKVRPELMTKGYISVVVNQSGTTIHILLAKQGMIPTQAMAMTMRIMTLVMATIIIIPQIDCCKLHTSFHSTRETALHADPQADQVVVDKAVAEVEVEVEEDLQVMAGGVRPLMRITTGKTALSRCPHLHPLEMALLVCMRQQSTTEA